MFNKCFGWICKFRKGLVIEMSEKKHWKRTKIKSDIVNVINSRLHIEKCINQIKEKKYLTYEQTTNEISYAIENAIPFFVGRFGQTEMNMVTQILNSRFLGITDLKEAALKQLCNNAGFFSYSMDLAEKFTDLMIESCKEVDIQANWNLYMEDYMINEYAPTAKITPLRNIAPWLKYREPEINSLPWSARLKGKKVLVINPFVDTIQKQYENNREYIFNKIYPAEYILPEFELYTVKAVQTIAGNRDDRFENWFDALQWMKDECEKIDFDVAIIGCGAYGYPLAAHIKKLGKVAIHLGGATQIMFGVYGKRWENFHSMKQNLINDYWVRPSEDEIPKNIDKVENGCYW